MHKVYPLCRISGEKCVRGGGRNGGQCDKWRKRKVADTNFLEKKIGCRTMSACGSRLALRSITINKS